MEATKVWETEGESERTDQKVVNGSNKSVGNRGRERKNGSEGSKWKQQKCGKQRERVKERIRRK